MAALSVSPNPSPAGSQVTVTGSGFPVLDTRLRLDGTTVVSAFKPSSSGSFSKLITVSSVSTTQLLVAQQRKGAGGAGWKEVARTSITVQSGATLTIGNIMVGNITQTGAVVSWSTGVPSTGYVKYGPTTAYGSETGHETSFNYSNHAQGISGLTANTTYHYKIVAGSQSGTIVESADGTFQTLASAPTATAPGAPTGLTAVSGDTYIDLAWVAPSSNGGSAVTGYRVYRNGVLAATLGVVTSWRDAGRTAGVLYTYQVTALNAIGEGVKSASASATIPVTGGTRPFAAPVTTATYTVPGTFDQTGTNDVAAALNNWIASVPNGSIISFPGSATYKLSKGILLAGRNNLVLQGNGATLRMSSIVGSDEAASVFLLRASSHIAINNFTADGSNAGPYTSLHGENTHILGLSGWYGGGPSSYVEMDHVTGSRTFGDAVYLEGRNISPYEPSHHIWIHDNTFTDLGRNGVSLIDATDVLVEHNSFNRMGMDVVDIEPNFAGQSIKRATFKSNSVGSFALLTAWEGWFLNTWNVPLIAPEDISLTDNDVVGNPTSAQSGTKRALSVLVDHAGRPQRIAITSNRTSQTVSGPAMTFINVDGVTVTGNTQPLTSGSLASFSGCTNVVSSPNP